MNLKSDCAPGLLNQHQRLTSLMLVWPKQEQTPHRHTQNLVESLPIRAEVIITVNGGLKYGMRCLNSTYVCDGQVSQRIWQYSICTMMAKSTCIIPSLGTKLLQ